MQVIRRLDTGQYQIGAALNLATSKKRTIFKNKEKYCHRQLCNKDMLATRITPPRNNTIQEMEKRLSIWIDDEIERNMPLNQSTFLIKRNKIGKTEEN
ncbi:hypothetical protein TNCV_2329791 [Trichonephila clavipes]|nr:hypothetical protein TNCV_2329791 [Trichonephila clavipes]